MAYNNKKKKYKLMIDYNSLNRDEIILAISDIKVKVRNILRAHVGKENAISPYELFEKIFEVTPEKMSIYSREFWWNIVKKVFRELRYHNEMFIINSKFKIFVLKSWDEYKSYEKQINNTIRELKKSKNKAYRWVKDEAWRKI